MSTVKLVNSYTPPSKPLPDPEELLHPKGGVYDINFCLPLPSKPLESSKVKLLPFLPPVHMPLLVNTTLPYPELYRYWSLGPFPTLESGLLAYERSIRSDPSATWFAVFDKTRLSPPPPGAAEGAKEEAAFAGVIGILAANPLQSQAEVGYVLYLPSFQRTHLGTHASGLLLHYLLDPPSEGGLGLRRVQWKANALNERSVAAGKRLGFRWEGVLRWHMVLPEGKEGLDVPEDGRDGRKGKGRHTAMLGMGWDDWEEGGRERIDALMGRE